jgi:hypothetical protein
MNKNRKKLGWFAVTLASVGLGVTGIAAAQPVNDGGARKAEMLAKYDTNHNGTLDPDERTALRADMRARFEARRAELVKKYDTNGDGTLDQGERTAMRDAMVKERFAKLDTNQDGALSLDEFEAGHAHRHHGRFGMRGHHHGGFAKPDAGK